MLVVSVLVVVVVGVTRETITFLPPLRCLPLGLGLLDPLDCVGLTETLVTVTS